MSAFWLFPFAVVVFSVCVLAALLTAITREATHLASSLARLQRLNVATDELSRATVRTKRSVSAVVDNVRDRSERNHRHRAP